MNAGSIPHAVLLRLGVQGRFVVVSSTELPQIMRWPVNVNRPATRERLREIPLRVGPSEANRRVVDDLEIWQLVTDTENLRRANRR